VAVAVEALALVVMVAAVDSDMARFNDGGGAGSVLSVCLSVVVVVGHKIIFLKLESRYYSQFSVFPEKKKYTKKLERKKTGKNF